MGQNLTVTVCPGYFTTGTKEIRDFEAQCWFTRRWWSRQAYLQVGHNKCLCFHNNQQSGPTRLSRVEDRQENLPFFFDHHTQDWSRKGLLEAKGKKGKRGLILFALEGRGLDITDLKFIRKLLGYNFRSKYVLPIEFCLPFLFPHFPFDFSISLSPSLVSNSCF